jgi:hypothetical protein
MTQVYFGAGDADGDRSGEGEFWGDALSIAQIIAIIPRKKILVFKCEDKRLINFEAGFDGN